MAPTDWYSRWEEAKEREMGLLEFKVDVEPQDVVEYVKELVGFKTIVGKVKALKGFDFWPFDEDGDEYKGVFQEMKHNMDLVADLATAVVSGLENAMVGVLELEQEEKHAIAKKALDDMIKVPWYAEFFDGIVIDMAINMAVKLAKTVDWGLSPNGTVKMGEVTTASTALALNRSAEESKARLLDIAASRRKDWAKDLDEAIDLDTE